MRIRTIKPEFWQNETIALLPEFTRLMAIALLNYADDHGYFMANHKLIHGNLFPFEDDSKKIPRAIDELSRVDYLQLGIDSKGRQVARVINFTKHQRVDKPKPSIIKEDFTIQDQSKTHPRSILGGMEGKGKEMERNGMDLSCRILSDDREVLDLFWEMTPSKGKTRTSKLKIEKAWAKIKKPDRPTIDDLKNCLAAWNQTQKWKDGFCEGMHIWINDRKWTYTPTPEATKSQGTYATRHANDNAENLEIPDL
jgi:hypothetical protein